MPHAALHDGERELLVRSSFTIFPALLFLCVISASAQDASQGHGAPTPLTDAVTEAENNNTQIAAADHAWRASANIVQQLPYSGGPSPWSEAAQREADTQHVQISVFRSNIADQVKTIYLRLAYLYQMYDLDDRGAADLAALIQNELSKYSLGMGSQADVLQAQLARIKLLRETTVHHEEVGGLQASLKALLHRLPDSPDIIPEPIAATPLKRSVSELLLKAANQNPTLTVDSKTIEAQSALLDAVKADTSSDLSLGYTFSGAGESYRDGYILSFSLQHPRGKQADAEIAAAGERLESSRLSSGRGPLARACGSAENNMSSSQAPMS